MPHCELTTRTQSLLLQQRRIVHTIRSKAAADLEMCIDAAKEQRPSDAVDLLECIGGTFISRFEPSVTSDCTRL